MNIDALAEGLAQALGSTADTGTRDQLEDTLDDLLGVVQDAMVTLMGSDDKTYIGWARSPAGTEQRDAI
jgi:hypothetical protein